MKHHEGKITERKLEEEFRRSREKMNKAIHSERREEELFRHKRR